MLYISHLKEFTLGVYFDFREKIESNQKIF